MEISKELFQPLDTKIIEEEKNVRPSITYWQDVWRRLKQNKVAIVSFYAIILIFVISIFGPMIYPYSYSDQAVGQENLAPCLSHPMGTDSLGRDVFVRIMYGGRISLSVGIVATIINLTIGVLYGAISGYFGGKTDNIMMRIVDILYSVPLMLYVILLSVVLKDGLKELFASSGGGMLKSAGPALISIYIALGVTYWIGMARIVRGEILRLKEQEYITAAKTLGAGHSRILIKHLIPNCIGSIIVTATLQIPSAIFTESFLSFVGLGVDAPMPSWGGLASNALGGLRSYPYLLIFPALAICVTILAFNLFGDGLRDALDPRMRK